ncbi:MAG: trypsin-like peptidase domain-containing protein [bacterium]
MRSNRTFRIPTLLPGLLALGLLLSGGTAKAQLSKGGTPPSFEKALAPQFSSVIMPPVDVDALLAEDAEMSKDEPFRFGYGFEVNYSLSNSGTWTELSDGGRVWRLRIESPGAYSINLIYDKYRIPAGAELFVYNEERGDKAMVIGAFTSANNKEHEEFATAPVAGDRIVVEYFEPAKVDFPGEIVISRVVHAYRDLFSWDTAKSALGFGSSGSCNNNVMCPEGDPWADQIRSVAMILTSGGSRICTGSMINNVRQDGTPYFLTANHCLGGNNTWIFMFNYQSPNCSNINGPTYMTVQGSTLKANYSNSDFALLELTETPPDSFGIYFNGWSAVDAESDSAVCIHHPAGDIKKISFDYDTYTSRDYLNESSGTTHWRISNWDDGTTEPGSSGSPLFNKHHQVIGQLHGGYASCTSITSDWFGKVAMSWNGGGSSSNQMKFWLDPDNTGTLALNGYDPNAGVTITHTPLPDTKDTVNAYEVICTIDGDTTLVADSLLLYFHTDVYPFWTPDTLTPTGGQNEYHGYIPTQSPGTEVTYYLQATSASGAADTTDQYTFNVVDYAMNVEPAQSVMTGAANTTVWHEITITNDGVYADNYDLALNPTVWTTKVWDASQTSEITETVAIQPDQSTTVYVSVEIPTSNYGDNDSTSLVVTSIDDGVISDFVWVQTISAGQPVNLPFFEPFASTTVDAALWVDWSGVTIDGVGLGEPSEPYSARFDGNPSGGDLLMSQAINLAGESGVNISYAYQQTGGGESPDAGDDLYVEYLNDAAQWILLAQYSGSGSDMTTFQSVSIPMPADGYHSGFRMRFSNTATSGAFDDWFVDDIRVDYGGAISVSPASFYVNLAKGDSTEQELRIANAGPGGISYNATVVPQASKFFRELTDRGLTQTARGSSGEDVVKIDLPKGAADYRSGRVVDKNAGGPDLYGYYWIDSDEPGGPDFDWIDVSGTGVEISGGLDDDNFIGPFSIGFEFPYYDSAFTEFYLSSNGYIGFGPTTDLGTQSNDHIPDAGTPNNIIAWCWDDLNPVEAGFSPSVYFDATSERCVIQFVDYPEYQASTGDVANAELILYPNGSIKVQYQSFGAGFDLTSATVGIEDRQGQDGLEVAHNTSYLHDNLAIEFSRPLHWLFMSSDQGDVAAGEEDTLMLKYVTTDLDSGTYLAEVRVYSNDPDPGDNPMVVNVELVVGGSGPTFTCGDADGDDLVNITDVVFIINYIFNSGPAPEPLAAWDADCSGAPNITDAVYLIAFIFGDGAAPCADCP